jgi:WD40 repeat protein
MNRRRLIASLLVGAAVAWGMFLAPLQWPRATLPGPERVNPAPSFFFSPDSRLLVTVHLQPRPEQGMSGNFGCARLWDAVNGKLLAVLTNEQRLINSVTFAPDGSDVAGRQEDGKILIWNRADGTLRREIWNRHLQAAHPNTQIVYTPNGRLLYQHDRNWTQMFDVETNELAVDVADVAVKFSETTIRFQDFLFAAKEHKAVAIRLDTGEVVANFRFGGDDAPQQQPVSQWGSGNANLGGNLSGGMNTTGALAADGRSYAAWTGNIAGEVVTIFRPDSALTLPPFPWHTSAWNNTRRLAVSSDANLLAAEGVENPRKWIFFGPPSNNERSRVYLIDARTGQGLGAISDAHTPAFSPDNRTLAVALDNGDVQLWDMPPRKSWGWIALGSAGTAGMTYLLLAWRARRREKCQAMPTSGRPRAA